MQLCRQARNYLIWVETELTLYIYITLTNNKYLDKVAFESWCPKKVHHQHPAIRHSTSYVLL